MPAQPSHAHLYASGPREKGSRAMQRRTRSLHGGSVLACVRCLIDINLLLRYGVPSLTGLGCRLCRCLLFLFHGVVACALVQPSRLRIAQPLGQFRSVLAAGARRSSARWLCLSSLGSRACLSALSPSGECSPLRCLRSAATPSPRTGRSGAHKLLQYLAHVILTADYINAAVFCTWLCPAQTAETTLLSLVRPVQLLLSQHD
eukprot:COSAG06_NODE_723_length_12799_cov_3.060157_4_plen_203_part_00